MLKHITALLLMIMVMFTNTVYAATATWDGAVNSTWDTITANWSGSTFVNNDDVVFGATGIGTITLGENISANSITFNNAGYVINSGGGFVPTLTGSSTITANQLGFVQQRIDGTSGFIKEGSNYLIIQPAAGAGPGNQIIPTGTRAINNGHLWMDLGPADQDRNFSGTWNINGNGSSIRVYGPTNQRHIFNSSTWNFGPLGNGTLQMDSVNYIVRDMTVTTSGGAKNFVRGTGGSGMNGQNTSNPVTFDVAPGTDPGGVDLEFSGRARNMKMAKSGNGLMQVISTINEISVGLDINAGTFELGGSGRIGNGNYTPNILNNGVLSHNSTANQIIGGIISGSGGITKNNTGTLTLSGINTYNGIVTVNGGILELGDNAGLGSTASGTIINNGGALNLAGFDPTPGEQINISGVGTDGVGGSGALYSTSNSGVLDGGSTLILSSDAEVGGGGGRMDNFGGIFDGVGSYILTKYGAEHWYQWGTTLNIDGLVVAPSAWWGQQLPTSPNTVTFQTGARHYTWGSPNIGTLDMTLEDDVRIHTEWQAGFSGTAIYGGTVTLNGTARFYSNLPEQTALFNANITGVGSIEKNGPHTLTFTGDNNYNETIIRDGTFEIQSGATEYNNLYAGHGGITNATVTQNGGTHTINGTTYIGFTGNGSLYVNSGAMTNIGQLNIGHLDGSTGYLHQTGGRVKAWRLMIGNQTTAEGEVILNGGEIEIDNNAYIGWSGLGSFTVSTGTVAIGNDVYLGGVNNNSTSVFEVVGTNYSVDIGRDFNLWNDKGQLSFVFVNDQIQEIVVDRNINLNGFGSVMFTNTSELPVGTYTLMTSTIGVVNGEFGQVLSSEPDFNGTVLYINDGNDHRVVLDIFPIEFTNGFVNASGENVLQWDAGNVPITRIFDIIYSDGDKWNNSLPAWQEIGQIQDDEYVDAVTPPALGEQMRFYRLSNDNRWQAAPPRASYSAYVTKNINLTGFADREGENFVSLFFEPPSNTIANILGTGLPSGASMGESTRIEFYGATLTGAPTNMVWLSSGSGWLYADSSDANNMQIPLYEGFNIILPQGTTTHKLTVVGKVPTNITGNIQIPIKANNNYNLVSWPLPYKVTLGNSGLAANFNGAGVGQGLNPNNSDELRILQRGNGSMGAPVARILKNSSGQFVYWTGGSRGASADNYKLNVDDTLIIYTKKSTVDWNWNISEPVDYRSVAP